MPWTVPTTQPTSKNDYSSVDKAAGQHSLADLQKFYTDGNSVDQGVFAEMRSNLLLVAGEHYTRRESLFYRRIRDSKELPQEQKLRLTKNHTRKICQAYANNIMSMAPGVGFTPKDEKSPHDQKVADMHHSVWRDAFQRYNIDDRMDDWCDSFIGIGEVAVKIVFDPTRGALKGYEPLTEPDGSPRLNEMGEMIPDEQSPIHTGEFVFTEIYGFNLLRPSDCKDLREAEWLCERIMMDAGDLKRKFPGHADQIQKSMDETYMVFDASYGGYYKAENQVAVRNFYFRPSPKYPRGYYYVSTREGILDKGELPGGIFPIIIQCFDKIQTTPRGRGPVKQMRPYQAEINRSASKIAEHQITLGDDKILIRNGTKVSSGASLPGVRSVSYTGETPTIMEGRSGAQYLDYMNSQITEMYMVMNVAEDTETQTQQLDPYVLLFRSARQKKKFQRYIKRFEKFLIEVVKTYLSLAKVHLVGDELIYAVGSNEQVNIAEFKALDDVCYEINIEAQADDIETKLGKQITLNHALQYIGNQLKPEDIGKIMRAMPFVDFDESFDDFTLDYDNSLNDVLALDRGEQPPVNEYDNHAYCIKRLVARTRKPDFRFLPPEVQANYAAKIQVHQQMQAQQALALQRAQQGLIPTGGYFVTCDFYVSDPSDPTGLKTRRARLPYEAVAWLIKQLEVQGSLVAQMDGMPAGAQAQLAEEFNAAGGGTPSPMNAALQGTGQFPGQRSPGQPNGMGMFGQGMAQARV